MKIKDGTVKTEAIEWVDDDPLFGKSTLAAGVYIYFGMWKGPFESVENAKSAYREWVWEKKHS